MSVTFECFVVFIANVWQNQVIENPKIALNFAESPRDKLLYRVFCHFWELGYFLTSGGKFGGDFLIYPGSFYYD